jgi:hypothetical protein
MVDRTHQLRSWVNLRGHPRARALIAQIFFPFDSARLDGDDRAKLHEITRAYRIWLLGRRIHMAVVGHADFRGQAAYNVGLGQRRANAVSVVLDGALLFSPHYTSAAMVSAGEEEAAQPSQGRVPTEHQTALDRRVDIFSNYVDQRPVQLPEIRIVGQVPTKTVLTHREFSFTHAEEGGGALMGGGPPNETDRLIDALSNWPAGSVEILRVMGSERMDRRRSTHVPVTHEVTAIRVTVEERYRTIPTGGSVVASETSLDYTWGRPQDMITITRNRSFRGIDGRESRRTTRSSYPRVQLSTDPIANPPRRE